MNKMALDFVQRPKVSDASKTSSEVFACFATAQAGTEFLLCRRIYEEILLAKKGRRGTGPILMAFSIVGILIGLFLINHGLNGNGLSSTITLILGIFVTVKEIIDAFH